jgi:predicted dehydrogenase
MSSQRRIRWGILSTANIARARVIPAIKQSRNGEVAAVASRTAERAHDFAMQNNIPTAFRSYEAMIESDAVDAIYIGTPNALHAEWAIKCAEAGKPTLCEKPLAKDAHEAQTMVDAFKERGVLFAEAFMYRFHPQTVKAKELVDAGAVGEMQAINAAFTFRVRDEGNVRLSQPLAGGSLMDVGCYCVNVMRHLTGEEPSEAKAVAQMGQTTHVDEWLAGALHFPRGVVGHFDCGLRGYRRHFYEVRGSTGRLQLDAAFVPDLDKPTTIQLWKGDDYEAIEIPAADHYQLMVEDFADALLLNRPPRFDAQDAVENMRVIDRLLGGVG